VELGTLDDQELGVAAVVALVALDAEVRRHRVEALVGAHELALARVDGHELAPTDEPALPDQLLAQARDQPDAAGAGDLGVGVGATCRRAITGIPVMAQMSLKFTSETSM
jgi:hypothetical protein